MHRAGPDHRVVLDEHRRRLTAARDATAAAGLSALLITPGADLRYLVGYDALPLERLTCLVLRAAADPVLVVPELEAPAAAASPVGPLGVQVRSWPETADPVALVADLVAAGGHAGAVGLSDQMWAEQVLRLRAAMPTVAQRLASPVLAPLRARKSADEVAALRRAGAAIDAVHAAMAQWLRPGRTERDVARDIAAAIVDAGHARADFVIVAGGPNGASPHHEAADRVLHAGDPVVVDIGGTTVDGYCSDCTRTYALGHAPAPFIESYRVLQEAQATAVAAVRPGVTAEQVDAAARDVIAAAGLGALFVHRTGHGIGLQTHEQPYIVQGNDTVLQEGMAFSVEPGVYHPGRYGARIEDIVVVTADGVESLNRRPHELEVV
jgi:Xaa-Pro aminopeptidase